MYTKKRLKDHKIIIDAIFKELSIDLSGAAPLENVIAVWKLSRLSRKEFAKLTGVHLSILSTNYLKTGRRIRLKTLQGVCEAFKISLVNICKADYYTRIYRQVKDYDKIWSGSELINYHSKVNNKSHWFGAAEMDYFGTIIYEIETLKTGIYFITSEKPPDYPRAFCIRVMNYVTGAIDTIGEVADSTHSQARKALKEIKESEV
jgi:DNA-binding Xre family transcriptional regulator